MKKLTAVIERNEDSFFAYIEKIDGCVAGGRSYEEVKSNLEEILRVMAEEDEEIKQTLGHGHELVFEVDLESIFALIPEVNITQLAKMGKMNPGLLRQYAVGTKRASEIQAGKIMKAIHLLSKKLESISLAI